MIVFELTMPNVGSWNGKWSQERELHIKCRRECDVPKEYWDKSFIYDFGDGWTACITVKHMSYEKAKKLEKKSKGFCDYDWMISSIILESDVIEVPDDISEDELYDMACDWVADNVAGFWVVIEE